MTVTNQGSGSASVRQLTKVDDRRNEQCLAKSEIEIGQGQIGTLRVINVTLFITDFFMSLIWAGVWAIAWAAGGFVLAAVGVGGLFVGLRLAWRRRGAGR